MRRWACDGCGRERCQRVPGRTVCTWCEPWIERTREKSDARGMERVRAHAETENDHRDWPGVFANDLSEYDAETCPHARIHGSTCLDCDAIVLQKPRGDT